MKVKHAIILIVLGYCVTLYGSLQKILHTPSADLILKIGMVTTILGFILFLYKLMSNPKFKDFMNS